jgi:hypothetical protein
MTRQSELEPAIPLGGRVNQQRFEVWRGSISRRSQPGQGRKAWEITFG